MTPCLHLENIALYTTLLFDGYVRASCHTFNKIGRDMFPMYGTCPMYVVVHVNASMDEVRKDLCI